MIGQTVRHSIFGEGVVSAVNGSSMTVVFGVGEKRFIYPEAFREHLAFEDGAEQRRIDRLFARIERTQKESLAAAEEERKRLNRVKTYKIHPSSQAAFNAEAPVSDWSVSTGRYLSGMSAGEIRIPERLAPNSACLLTRVPPRGGEAGRQIVGAFMVEEDFFGDECRDGVINAHPDYRIELAEREFLPFWSYFPEKPRPRWGSVPFKFFPNLLMQHILIDMTDAADGERAEEIKAFFNYFSRVNELR